MDKTIYSTVCQSKGHKYYFSESLVDSQIITGVCSQCGGVIHADKNANETRIGIMSDSLKQNSAIPAHIMSI